VGLAFVAHGILYQVSHSYLNLFNGPCYHAALSFSGLGVIVFVVCLSLAHCFLSQFREAFQELRCGLPFRVLNDYIIRTFLVPFKLEHPVSLAVRILKTNTKSDCSNRSFRVRAQGTCPAKHAYNKTPQQDPSYKHYEGLSSHHSFALQTLTRFARAFQL